MVYYLKFYLEWWYLIVYFYMLFEDLKIKNFDIEWNYILINYINLKVSWFVGFYLIVVF